MISGILAGVTWALGTVILGIALAMAPFLQTEQAIFLAPFVSTFLHDAFSAAILWIYNLVRGQGREALRLLRHKSCKFLVLSSSIGGPVGMTGYVLAVNCMGASVGAVASAIYPAIGSILAFLFLKEKVRPYQWIFLVLTMAGVYGLSFSPQMAVSNFWLGLLGVAMCAFGWGIEAVILAKCLKDPNLKNEHVLQLRQTVSAAIYGIIILPLVGGWGFTVQLVTEHAAQLLPVIAGAALCASVSYLFYYKAIAKLGAAKAMALNITYTAWALVFTVVLLRDFSVLNPLTVICALVVVVCGILAATDLKQLFGRKEA